MDIKFNKILDEIDKFAEKVKEKGAFFRKFISYSVLYGFIINYMLTGIFGIRFGLFTFPAYGVLFWLIEKDVSGCPINLYQIRPDRITPITTEEKIISGNSYWDCLMILPKIIRHFAKVDINKIRRIYNEYPNNHHYSKTTVKCLILHDLCIAKIQSKGTTVLGK